MKFAPSGLQQMVRAPHAGPLRKVLRYTAPFMSYAANPFTTARANAFQGMGMMPRAPTREPRDTLLTPRELDVLTMFSRGLSYRETADTLGVSTHTVTDHVKAIYAKMAVDVSSADAMHKFLSESLYTLASDQAISFKLIFINETETEYLMVEEGTPVHLLECILYGADGTPLARCKHYMRPEYYKIEYTVKI